MPQASLTDATRATAPPLHGGKTSLLPRLAFVHIPKTAGTSITSALMRGYGAAQTLPAMTTLDYRCYSEAQLAEYWFYKGHAYRHDYERLPEGTRRLTVLRDPVDRALSYFSYYRDLDDANITDQFVLEASRMAKSCSVVEFIYSDSPFIIEHLRLGQVRQFMPAALLAALGHRQFLSRNLRGQVLDAFVMEMDRFDFVLTSELLFLTFPMVAECLGLPRSCRALPRENATVSPAGIDPADVRRALVDVNPAEFSCYDHVRRRELAWLADAMPARRPADPNPERARSAMHQSLADGVAGAQAHLQDAAVRAN